MSAGWIVIMSYIILICFIVYVGINLKTNKVMKELSIEEKAKAYDKALAVARDFYNSTKYAKSHVEVKATYEAIFPVLAESKNERIRKSLIAIITDFENLYLQENHSLSKKEALAWLEKLGQIKSPISQHENKMCLISKDERIRAQLIEFFSGYNTDEEWWGSITEKDILAWLEKQGEPKEINPSEFDSQLNRLLGQFKSLPKEELASSLSFYLNVVQNDGTYKEEKQGEQKPAIEMKTPEESLGIDSNTYNKIVDECIYGEQKPANKAEPKFKIGDNIEPIDSCLGSPLTIYKICDGFYETNQGTLDFEFENNWRLTEQKSAWSEEDERNMGGIVSDLEYLKDKANAKTLKERFQDKIDWIKSLRPQNRWKPSESQLEALDDFIYAKYPNIEKYEASVKSLYQDLKKLKG